MGGFLVPESALSMFKQVLEGEWILTGEDDMTTNWVITDEDKVVSVEHIESFGYNLHEITEELSLADVWAIELEVQMQSGAEHTIDDSDEVLKFVKHLQNHGDNSLMNAKPGTLGYYVGNAARHEAMVKEADKLNNG